MQTGSLLLVVGFAVLAVYLALFVWTFRAAGQQETMRYTRTFSGATSTNVGVMLVCATFAMPNATLTMLLGVIGLVWVGRASHVQHAKMRELGFDKTFEKRLSRVNMIAPIAILLLMGGKVWFVTHAS